MPNEKKSACARDLVGGERGPRHLDHGADVDAQLVAALLLDHLFGQRPQPPQLLGEADQRVHDLDALGRDRDRGSHDRAHLHLVDLGVHQAQPAAAGAQHRVLLGQRPHPAGDPLQLGDLGFRTALGAPVRNLLGQVAARRAGTRAAAGRAAGSSRAALPSPRRCRGSRPPGTAAAGRAARGGAASSTAMIMACTTGSRSSPKNMCSVRQRPIPSAPSSPGLGSIARSVGVGPHAQPPHLISPARDRLEVLVQLRRHQRHRAQHHLAGGAVDRDLVALATRPCRRR